MTYDGKWFAVVNPHSGNGKTAKNWPNLYKLLLQNNIEIEYEYTSSQGEGIVLAKQAQDFGYKKIIAVGGDGTVNEVLNGLLADKENYKDMELAILEHGTGSDFVRSFQQKKGINNFIKLLRRNKSVKVDIGRLDFESINGSQESRYFLNAVNLGIGAEVVNRVNNNSKALGSKITYFKGTIATLLNFENVEVTCQLDNDEIIEGKYKGLIICNGQYMGGGMHIAPQAQTNDGLFEIVFIKDLTKLRFLTCFPSIYLGKHINLPEIVIYRSKKISITTKEQTIFEADGEIPGLSPLVCQIIPKAITLRI
ncbi:MAG: hypothetical protein APF84_03710 [Gracilibacter sp. BRH_c7a]|nr:MAG: hypothetical protein APF84_03710 [Gracilibacter sp. BRH_c7a]